MARRKKQSIRIRILLLILLLITVTFLLIQAVFNFAVREYIVHSVNEQLQGVLSYNQERGQFRLPRGPAGSAQVMVITENYHLVLPELGLGLRNFEEVHALASQIAAQGVNLDSANIMNIKASNRDYYFVSLNPGSGYYYIYYFDMTAISAFADQINTTLFWVMGFAGLLAVSVAIFLSGIIARPVRELTRFALRIGEGDFSMGTMDYQDAELAELAESMNRAASQLDHYDRNQKTFFQNVSHELRTPLQAIRSSAEGIEHGILDPREASKVVISETDRLSDMVEDLLFLSRIDRISRVKLEKCDLRELLSNCAERQRGLAQLRGVEFSFDFPGQPVELDCDEKGLCRAFSNLVSNAIRYAESSITLSCHRFDGKIEISVADDGRGIGQEDMPYIFDRFYKGKGGKHGIGLAIAKTVIEQHGGRIRAHNDGGAVFSVIFPVTG